MNNWNPLLIQAGHKIIEKNFDAGTARAIAKKKGKKYYIGAPCKYGHNGTRRVSNAGCVECNIIRNKKRILKGKRRRKKYD